MTNYELIKARHSVREYLDKPIEEEKRQILNDYIKDLNDKYNTNVQIFYDDPQGFKNGKADYGNFANCKNYIALVGNDAETCGYVGELIVIKAQSLSLNTCFVALTYDISYVKKQINIKGNEKLQCNIALGYGRTQGFSRRSKTKDQILTVVGEPPKNLDLIVEAALLAPTAVNQQKFKIECNNGQVNIKKSGVGFLMDMDLGIVKANVDLILEDFKDE